MEQVQKILEGQDLIPLTVLPDLGRRSLRAVFEDETIQMPLADVEQLWLRIQRTACSAAVADKYLTAAYNVICVFLHYTCRSSQLEVSAFGFSERVWFQALEAVHKAFGDGRNKPAVQVLETLVQILQDHDDRSIACRRLQQVIGEMVRILVIGQPVTRAKEACILLSFFLRKGQNLVPLAQYFEGWQSEIEASFQIRCQQVGIETRHIDNCSDKTLGKFLLTLLLTASNRETRAAAIKLFSLLCTRTEKIDFSQNVGIASFIIEIYLQANNDALEGFSVDVFPAVLTDEGQFDKFLTQFDPSEHFTTSRLSVFFAILQVGQNKGFVTETDLLSITTNALADKSAPEKQDRQDYAGLRYSLMCAVPTIRLQAFGLLTISNATNTPVSAGVLQCLTHSFKYLHDDTDSSYRDMYTGLFRRLVNRLEKSEYAARRSEHSNPGSNEVVLESYSAFLKAWNTLLLLELSPQVSYQRHILALQILHLTIPLSKTVGLPALPLDLEKTLNVGLFNLLFDAFDDVRSQAGILLIKLANYNRDLTKLCLVEFGLIELGRRMSANTNRADHADALGRIIMLAAYTDGLMIQPDPAHEEGTPNPHSISSLVSSIEDYIASISAFTPSSDFPIHGSLLGVTYSVRLAATVSKRLDRDILVRLLQICQKVWTLVLGDLCIDSPETEVEENQDAGSEGPKDLLAYSWRALRDSSLVMQALLDTQPLDSDLYQSIGDLCFDQLKRLRHRGAFSAVAQTFALCCQKIRISDDRLGRGLDEPWFEAAFEEIVQQSGRLTRRSAGLPSMFAALLDPATPRQFLVGVQKLTRIARQNSDVQDARHAKEIRLPQVHALNCLKGIMTNSRFRLITESLVAEMLTLSSQCLSSEIWAIRNCGLMLFRACIDRLTPDSSNPYGLDAIDLDETEVRTPLAVALSLLQDQSAVARRDDELSTQLVSKQSEIVFAALDLLGRIPGRPETYERMDKSINAQFSSELWAVREHAARLRAMNASDDGHSAAIRMLLSLKLDISANQQHSWLLCVRYLLQNCWPIWNPAKKNEFSHRMVSSLIELGNTTYLDGLHPMVSATAFDLLNDIFARMMAECIDCSDIAACSVMFKQQKTLRADSLKSFLLHRAFALNQAYACIHELQIDLSNDSETDYVHLVSAVPAEEPDVAAYVIEELVRRLADVYPARVLRVFIHMTLSTRSEDTQALLYLRMSELLPHTELSITGSTLKVLVDLLCLQQAQSRDMWNGQIRFAATLLSYTRDHGVPVDQPLLDDLVSALRISQQDEIEMPTRMHAAQAIADLVPLLTNVDVPAEQTPLTAAIRLQILMVLYDLLNDDEEEIRAIAADATYKFVQICHHLRYVMSGCAAAAREVLREYMLSEFGASAQLIASACLQIVGAKPPTAQNEVEHLVEFCRSNPVTETIATVLDRAGDLFAEERQNLYLDDIANIEAWVTALGSLNPNVLGGNAIKTLILWVSEGLDTLSTLLDKDAHDTHSSTASVVASRNEIIHPLGLTYNVDILIICIRVISLATLLQSIQVAGHQNTVTNQLHQLQVISQKHRVHQRILMALECPPGSQSAIAHPAFTS